MAWFLSGLLSRAYRETDPTLPVSAAMPKVNGKIEHQKALHHSKIKPVLTAIRKSGAYRPAIDCLEWITLTACRSNEGRGATWDEIDMDNRTWTIPADRMKAGREHVIPLSDQAMEVLARAGQYADNSGLIYPSATGKVLHDYRVSKLLEGHPGTVHGMRAAFRDWCAETGQDRQLAETALAHVVGGVEGAYLRTNMIEQRQRINAVLG